MNCFLSSYIASGQVYARVKRVGAKQLCQQTDGSQDQQEPINSRILYNLAKISKLHW